MKLKVNPKIVQAFVLRDLIKAAVKLSELQGALPSTSDKRLMADVQRRLDKKLKSLDWLDLGCPADEYEQAIKNALRG